MEREWAITIISDDGERDDVMPVEYRQYKRFEVEGVEVIDLFED